MASMQYLAVDVPLENQAPATKRQAAHIQRLTDTTFQCSSLCFNMKFLAPFGTTLCLTSSQE
jgi:hypothetical protein